MQLIGLSPRTTSGSALLEVLITLVILAFGILGVAGLQARVYVLEFESYQRAQAVVMLNDLIERISGNPDATAAYVAASPMGGTGVITDCSALTEAARDACELGNLLNGSGEKVGTTAVGGMSKAMACVTTFTDVTTKAFNRCQTGIQVSIVWKGRSATIVPSSSCGTTGGSPLYSSTDATRRAVTMRVGTGDAGC